MIDTKHFSVKEVAEMLNVQEQMIYKYIKEGKLNAVKLGGSLIRVPHKELLYFYAKSQVGGEWK